MIPDVMRAIEISGAGAPEVLKPARRPVPVAGHGQILIRIAWAGVNRPDLLQRAGFYAPPPGASDLPGLECAGTVLSVGPGVTRWKPGDRVCALLPGGGYAEYATCAAEHALPIPEGLDLRAAAALPETAYTVWSNVVMRGGLQSGERFLVHGGTSGIGTIAIQVARALGATVWATAGSDAKCIACAELGARPINYREEDFVAVMRKAGGADLILDMVGGDYIERNITSLADDGRLVMIAFLSGPKARINFLPVMSRRLTLTGSTLRPQSDHAKALIAQELEARLWPLIASGAVCPLIDSTFALQDAVEAHRRMESSNHVGKILLQVSEES
ncbi:putative NAD(P)H quinone oxidoreductase, PIG3 family [Paracoccus halophilus]|uniref:NAD(P)H-quinone oxidoreductase n=1 Tax=Paracoccus halophilus TaxID=376733 RepID=A0A099F6H1_9RHOB|nr:NAD(P)H-quinone oxidoreductase [Paracoccus halophilus]KGJ05851.1 NAD(P)H-quinone oxidoreductase [Paracoccus halophilus]SFA40700.1 putative NAD(P)H quinone oxidoreductase, PIG3 family [Paracoccus halophilus]